MSFRLIKLTYFILILLVITPARGEKLSDYVIIENDTISDVLWIKEITPLYGPKGSVNKVLKINKISEEEEKKLKPGRIIQIPFQGKLETDKKIQEAGLSIPPHNEVKPENKLSWAPEVILFSQSIRESGPFGRINSNKELQLAYGLRNWFSLKQFSFESQIFMTKIRGAKNFPIEWGGSLRIKKNDIKIKKIIPYMGIGVERFSHLTINSSNQTEVSENQIFQIGPGLRKEFALFNNPTYLSIEYLLLPYVSSESYKSINGNGHIFHPWISIETQKMFFLEIHYQKLKFKTLGTTNSDRTYLTLGYKF